MTRDVEYACVWLAISTSVVINENAAAFKPHTTLAPACRRNPSQIAEEALADQPGETAVGTLSSPLVHEGHFSAHVVSI